MNGVAARIIVVARATLGGAFARERARLTLAVLSIACGVALGFAVDLVNRTAVTEFASGMATLSGTADLEVRGPRAGFGEDVYPIVARAEGIAVASPIVEVDARASGFDDTLTIFGIDAFRAARVTPSLVGVAKETVDLLDPRAIFLSARAMERFNTHVGATLTLRVGSEEQKFRVAGLTPDGGRERYAVMDIAAVQDTFARNGTLTRIDLRVAPGVDPAGVARQLAERLPAGLVASSPATAIDAARRASRAYRVNLDVLALVALFTGGLLVFSTQVLAVARRRSQFALVRTLGLTRRQLVGLVVGEGAAIGAAGAIVGLPLGYALARLALVYFGGDLGAGFFRGVSPALEIGVVSALSFTALGIGAAIAGSAIPAIEAAHAKPAVALKSDGAAVAFAHAYSAVPGLALLALGAVATLAPPIDGLPLLGYAAIAALLFGTLLLLPQIVAWLLRLAPQPVRVPAALALDQLRDSPEQATVSLAAIVASVALMVSMAIMVASFRQSLDDWLTQVLPADVYLRSSASDGVVLSLDDQHRIAATPGVRRAVFSRVQSVLLDPSRPRVTVIARPIDDPSRLPLVSAPVPAASNAPPVIYATEAAQDLYGFTPGSKITIPLAGKRIEFQVAGVWRDYARQQGALLIDRDVYAALTGDRDANDAAVWLAAGVSIDDFRTSLAAQIDDANRFTIVSAGDLRRISLRVFDRTFAVTYALEAAAVLIGLAGMASSFGALALARRREFGMLRHLGMTRRQIGAMLATQGATISALGLFIGLTLGALISLILIHVVNRQSFHWSMDLSIPWSALASFSLVLLALATATSLVAAREAMSEDAVRVVKDDW